MLLIVDLQNFELTIMKTFPSSLLRVIEAEGAVEGKALFDFPPAHHESEKGVCFVCDTECAWLWKWLGTRVARTGRLCTVEAAGRNANTQHLGPAVARTFGL